MTRIAAVVFDLAGVLLDFGGVESIGRLSRGRVGPAQFGRFWQTPWADALYTGLSSPEEFAAGAIEYFGLDVAPDDFLAEFRTWLRGPYAGAFELLEEVRRRTTVACLSNTNCLDVARFRGELRLDDRFDYCFFSNEIGRRKPAADCYTHVLECMGLSAHAGRVVFFDDSPECVRGAVAVGMQAYECAGVDALRSHLQAIALL